MFQPLKQMFFVAVLCCVATSFAYAQKLKITGSVRESATEPAISAPIALMRASEASPVMVKAVASDVEGNFAFDGLAAGDYFLAITYLGFKDFKSPIIRLTTENITLEPFTLEKTATELKGVTVTAQKQIVEVLADKTVFNVQGTLNATGTNGFELLRKAPGVTIDNNENLVVEGKNGVQVFIDGKLTVLSGQDLSNYLKTIQSADIDAIEVITQPSSKYDAAGTAGIINIKFKRNKNFGTNGSVGLGYAYGKYSKYNGSLSLNNRNQYTSTFLNYSGRLGDNWNNMVFNRTQQDMLYAQNALTLSHDNSHNLKAGADFFASKKSTFGALLSANLNNTETDMTTRTPISVASTQELTRVLLAKNNTAMNFLNLTGNLNYRFADTLGHTLSADLDFGRYQNTRTTSQPNWVYDAAEKNALYATDYAMDTDVKINIASVKVDYEQKLKGGKLALGVKSSLVQTDNGFKFFNVADGKQYLDNVRTNDFAYKENVNAGYVNYNYKWKKVNVQAGVRVENTVSEGKLMNTQQKQDSLVQRNYTNLFPSAGITYTASKNHSFALTYSRRIERPNYQILNPFRRQMDTLSFRSGNAYLRPQYVDNLKLSHTFHQAFVTAVSYSRIQDFFAQITEALPNGRTSIMEQNVATQEVWNLSMAYPIPVAKWWNIYINANLSYSSFKGKNDNFIALQQTSFGGSAQNNFSLPNGWRFELSGMFQSPSIWGGTYVINSLGSVDVALQKNFLHDKLNMRLAFNDVFFTQPWYGSMQFSGLKIEGNGKWESRILRLNLTYNFGGKEVKASRKRNTGIDDENNRLGGN